MNEYYGKGDRNIWGIPGDHRGVPGDHITQTLLCTTVVRFSFHIRQSHWSRLLQSLAVCVHTTITSSRNTKGADVALRSSSTGKAEPLCSGLILGGHCIPTSLEHSIAVDKILADSVPLYI